MLSKNQVKEIQSLHQKKKRDEKKLFIAEGIKTVNEIIEYAPELIKELYVTNSFASDPAFKNSNQPHLMVSDEELGKISLQSSPNGTLAVCRYFEEAEPNIDFEKQFSFYLDDIRDPGNFGTIIRLASWYGISTVFCSLACCDLYNPKVIQSSMGAFLRVKIVYAPLAELKTKYRIKNVYGALLSGKNVYNQALRNGLIVIGNEANGIGSENLKHINQPITIPAGVNNRSESLNAAMAASIIGSEFFRQLLNKTS